MDMNPERELVRSARPRRCPVCGGEVCDVIYGMVSLDAVEEYLLKHNRRAVLGGCSLAECNARWRCCDCGVSIFASGGGADAEDIIYLTFGSVCEDAGVSGFMHFAYNVLTKEMAQSYWAKSALANICCEGEDVVNELVVDEMRRFFESGGADDLMRIKQPVLEDICDGCRYVLNIQRKGKMKKIYANSLNIEEVSLLDFFAGLEMRLKEELLK